MNRVCTIERKTNETDIKLTINIDGQGKSSIDTGHGFLDHMLESFAKHGAFDLDIFCDGDIEVDYHHTTEDIGIVLGCAFKKALGDMKGIRRFASFLIPMDEALARTVIDISGRPTLVFNADFKDRNINGFDCDLTEDFFKAFVDNAKITLHIDLLRGRNSHHSIEAIFKSVAKALSYASSIDDNNKNEIPSTKGIL